MPIVRWIFSLRFLAGAVLAALVVAGILYKDSGRDLLRKVRHRLGLATTDQQRYAHGLEPRRLLGALPDPVEPTREKEWLVREGFDLERVASGFSYPVNIVFDARPDAGDEAPLFYVNELHGCIKYVTRAGKTGILISGLLNFPPIDKDFSDELGLSGMCQIPGSRDLLITHPREDAATRRLINLVERLRLDASGTKVLGRDEVLVMTGEFTSPSHQIQQIVPAPDGTFLVSVGDGMNYPVAMDLDAWGGKILRMKEDGSAPPDNPFHDPARPRSPRSYVYAYGVRNVFDLSFDPRNAGLCVASDNGVNVDRIMRLTKGACYGWNGLVDSLRTNSLFCWGPPATSPTGIRILATDVLGKERKGRLFVALFGPDRASGIVEADLDPVSGMLREAPSGFLMHRSRKEWGRATVLALAEGPDGLYFTDFFGSTTEATDDEGGVWRVFPSEETRGAPRVSLRPLDWSVMLPGAKGRYLVQEEQPCLACHVLKDKGSSVGPPFDGVASRLDARIAAPSYIDALASLERQSTLFAANKPLYDTLRELSGRARVRQWLLFHLRNPGFDNPAPRMPRFELPAEDLELIADYLLFIGS